MTATKRRQIIFDEMSSIPGEGVHGYCILQYFTCTVHLQYVIHLYIHYIGACTSTCM